MSHTQQEFDPTIELDPIRRSAIDTEPLNEETTAYYLTQLAEHEAYQNDPQGFDRLFQVRYEAAVGEILSLKQSGEKRFRLSRDAAGLLVKTEVSLEGERDADDVINQLYDRLEEADAPILKVLDRVRQEKALVGKEHKTILRLCIILAAQNLPATDE